MTETQTFLTKFWEAFMEEDNDFSKTMERVVGKEITDRLSAMVGLIALISIGDNRLFGNNILGYLSTCYKDKPIEWMAGSLLGIFVSLQYRDKMLHPTSIHSTIVARALLFRLEIDSNNITENDWRKIEARLVEDQKEAKEKGVNI